MEARKIIVISWMLVIVMFSIALAINISARKDRCIQTLYKGQIVTVTEDPATKNISFNVFVQGNEAVQHATIASTTASTHKREIKVGKDLVACYFIQDHAL